MTDDHGDVNELIDQPIVWEDCGPAPDVADPDEEADPTDRYERLGAQYEALIRAWGW